ncbi:threonine/serine dehydratase [Paracoccus sp. NGMCC 1.201697]|uniref:Threonine/serine dehydratase n=1 Tax=Paracoccus broussonetiae subsp. drimophilus TaxID=3373869 RepID=A0ABW7LEZ7_9RHOB
MPNENERLDRRVSAPDILRAAQNIRPVIRATPLDRSMELSGLVGAEVRLKLENQQATGSFKLRGAANVIAHLDDRERATGVIAPTAGNHGLALAQAGRAAGVPVTICLPRTADPMKIAAMTANAAQIEFFDGIEEARQAALAQAHQGGARFVSAYDNPQMIAGGGTVGLEILTDWVDVQVILVCIGGGGLASGIATIAKAINPDVEIWAIQSEVSPTFIRWKQAGTQVQVDLAPSIAEGISGFIEPGTMTWPMVRDRVDRVLPVTEAEIRGAMLWMLDHHQQVVEPSGAAAVAGAIRYADSLAGRRTAAVVTGGNVSGARYRALLQA